MRSKMCGIFGIIANQGLNLKTLELNSAINSLFKLSESRGKEASGIAIKNDESIFVYKQPTSASQMINSKIYKKLFKQAFNKKIKSPFSVIGHSRLVTNGLQTLRNNNQPVIKKGSVGIHNGIIVNVDNLWNKYKNLKKEYEIDTEVFLELVNLFRTKGNSIPKAIQQTFKQIKGAASVALVFNDSPNLVLATNTGSLYTLTTAKKEIFIFASEKYILKMFAKTGFVKKFLNGWKIEQIKPGEALLLNPIDLNIKKFHLDKRVSLKEDKMKNPMKIFDLSQKDKPLKKGFLNKADAKQILKDFNKFEQNIWKLKRCSKCILPETFPTIAFDNKGVCNYCKNYKKINFLGEEALEKIADKYRSKDGRPDCIVAFSGGRDSSYALHYMKEVLKMHPIAYTYDWGMVTDLARRNQARLCGKLGVEHILISADITKKRENIRRNVLAWIKKPSLGLVPLFMAGDKQYFYYMKQLQEQTGIKLVIMGENLLEKTEFKYGFGKVKKKTSDEHTYTLSSSNKLKLASYYLSHFLKNPSYLNKSIFDTISAYASYYLLKHDFLNIYEYFKWDEGKIIPSLRKEYDWELSEDTDTTWRIGDGTAPFYNYIYYVLAGFSEFDTFLSNQIREGQIKRNQALKLSKKYNRPRFESLQWYADIVGFDLNKALLKINAAPKLYD
jgi:asparagine synthetase B (glutamine-hydrolysing)